MRQIDKIVAVEEPDKVVRRAKFSYDEMYTAIAEIEAIVNSRSLAYLHPDDLEQPLTPSHLLVGRRLLSLPDHLTYLEPEDDEDFELAMEAFQRRTKHLNCVFLEKMEPRISPRVERRSPLVKY